MKIRHKKERVQIISNHIYESTSVTLFFFQKSEDQDS